MVLDLSACAVIRGGGIMPGGGRPAAVSGGGVIPEQAFSNSIAASNTPVPTVFFHALFENTFNTIDKPF